MTFPKVTIGLDVGDRYTQLCALDDAGETIEVGRVPTMRAAFTRRFAGMEPARIVLEVGTHSPWISRLLEERGHEVLVANPRAISRRGQDKSDSIDAESLARWGRSDPRMLRPIQHREESIQVDLATLRSRDVLVGTRTKLINHVRGTVKSLGYRLPKCATASFHRQAAVHLPTELLPALKPVLTTISELSERIRAYDRAVLAMCEQSYPDTSRLTQVRGVGAVTALAFVLSLGDPHRFGRSRSVGAYLGLKPTQYESGASRSQLPISKRGDVLVRKLLVQCAHYILGPFGGDGDLRRWGLQIASRGGSHAKKRAAVAVARKLAVLLHALWVSGMEYEPLRLATRRAA